MVAHTLIDVAVIKNQRKQADIAGYDGRLNVAASDVHRSGSVTIHIACIEHVANISTSKEQDLSWKLARNVSGEANCWRVSNWVEE